MACDRVELRQRLVRAALVECDESGDVFLRGHVGAFALLEVGERGIAILLLDLALPRLPSLVSLDALRLEQLSLVEVPERQGQRVRRARLAEPRLPCRLQRFA